MNPDALLATRTFDEADQQRFATLSGDHNPMHVDAAAARRTQAGGLVVHGVHLMLWALEHFVAAQPAGRFAAIAARFERFVYVGEEVSAVLAAAPSGKLAIEIRTGQTRAAVITLDTAGSGAAARPGGSAPHPLGPPVLRTLDDLPGLSGAFVVAGDEASAAASFPNLSGTIGAGRVRSLATLSTLVGMECPGLLSIFSKLSVRFDEQAGGDDALHYAVRRVQPFLRSVVVDLAAPGLLGHVEAFVRQPPIAQPSSEALRPLVPQPFCEGARILVVGGSRGLGEVTAKLLALGGGHVTITFARGKAEALAVAQDIADAGASAGVGAGAGAEGAGGTCEIAQFDVTQPVAPQMAQLGAGFTHCYYFATPPIFRKRGFVFDPATLESFLRFYVHAFSDLAQALIADRPEARLFYPSTSAIDERPKGSVEYVMAKLAGEALCQEFDRAFPAAQLLVERLPRILTDQTATVLPVQSADPSALLLPILRAMHKADA